MRENNFYEDEKTIRDKRQSENDIISEQIDCLEQIIFLRKRNLLHSRIFVNSVFFVFFIFMVSFSFFYLPEKPVLQKRGNISEVSVKHDAIICRVDSQYYKLSLNYIWGTEIPTSPRIGDEVAIYKRNGNIFAVTPFLSEAEVADKTETYGLFYVQIVLFSICLLVSIYFLFLNIRRLRYLKK